MMARGHWGGKRSLESQIRGLRTRYDNGNLSREAMIAAYRRGAEQLETRANTSLVSSPTDRGWARAWRKRADELAVQQEAAQ